MKRFIVEIDEKTFAEIKEVVRAANEWNEQSDVATVASLFTQEIDSDVFDWQDDVVVRKVSEDVEDNWLGL